MAGLLFQFNPGDHVYARRRQGEVFTIIEGYRNDAGFPIYRVWSPQSGEVEIPQIELSLDRL